MHLDALSIDGRAVLDALISARLAWMTPGELAALAGLDRDEVLDILADLQAAGWVAHWETEHKVEVTLTPWAAEQLGVRLIEVGTEEIPRWARLEEPDPPPPKSKHVLTRYSALALVADPRPGPAELAEEPAAPDPASEATENRRRRDARRRAEKSRERRKARRSRLVSRRKNA